MNIFCGLLLIAFPIFCFVMPIITAINDNDVY